MPKTEFMIDANDPGLSLMDLGPNMPISLNETLGLNVAQLRKEQGLSRNELGRLTGLRASSIFRIETGGSSPRLQTIEKLARALHVHPSELLV